MNDRTAYVDYQQRATEFNVGSYVYLFGTGPQMSGRVVAVWPAIGMVDVEWPHGSQRLPVEDLFIYEHKDYIPPQVGHDNVPGGKGSVSVPGGPKTPKGAAREVADAFVKKALYWTGKDRRYKAKKSEIDSDCFICPKCKEVELKKAIYKRREGKSELLLGCPSCMFLIKRDDIIKEDTSTFGKERKEWPI